MEELHQHIEDYLNNRLDDTEKAIFEARLKEDAEFKEEVVKLQLLRQIAKRNATRTKIQEIQAQKLEEWQAESNEISDEEVEARPKFKVLRSFGTMVAAASVAIICFLNFSAVTLPNEATLAERGKGEEIDSVQKINFENYQIAQIALRKEDNTKAIEYFEKVINGTDVRPYYRDASKWFIAVANVEKEPKKAEELMQDILSKKDFKYEVSFVDKARMWTKIQINKLKNGF